MKFHEYHRCGFTQIYCTHCFVYIFLEDFCSKNEKLNGINCRVIDHQLDTLNGQHSDHLIISYPVQQLRLTCTARLNPPSPLQTHCSFLSPQLAPPARRLQGANPLWIGSFPTCELLPNDVLLPVASRHQSLFKSIWCSQEIFFFSHFTFSTYCESVQILINKRWAHAQRFLT